jgi:Ca2+-binding RTX toxin-like protein
VLIGNGGHDGLYAGDGDDELYGGVGDDWMFGGNSNDFLYGGTGNNVMFGGPGTDWIIGGAGNDYIFAGLGDNQHVWGGGGTSGASDWFEFAYTDEADGSTKVTIHDFNGLNDAAPDTLRFEGWNNPEVDPWTFTNHLVDTNGDLQLDSTRCFFTPPSGVASVEVIILGQTFTNDILDFAIVLGAVAE